MFIIFFTQKQKKKNSMILTPINIATETANPTTKFVDSLDAMTTNITIKVNVISITNPTPTSTSL